MIQTTYNISSDEEINNLSPKPSTSYESFYSANDSDNNSPQTINNGRSSSASIKKKKKKFKHSGIKLPSGFLDPLPTLPQKPQSHSQVSKAASDRRKFSSCLNEEIRGTKTGFCEFCVRKWESDMMEMKSFDVNNFTTYLRREFRSGDFVEVEKRLRDWEEEELKTKELARKAGNLEVELKDSKKKYYEVTVGMGKLESVMSDIEKELEVYKAANEELRAKAARLENMIRDKCRVISKLNETCDEYKVANEELRVKAARLEDINTEKSRLVSELNKTRDKLREKVFHLQEVNRNKGKELVELNKYKVACDELRGKVTRFEDIIRDNCRVVIERNKTCEELREKVSHLEEVNRDKGKELVQLGKYKVDCIELKGKAALLEETNRDRCRVISELNKTCEEFRERVSYLEEVIRDKSEELVELSKYKVACEELRVKAACREEINRYKRRVLSELNKTCDEHRERVSHLEEVRMHKDKVACDELRLTIPHLEKDGHNNKELKTYSRVLRSQKKQPPSGTTNLEMESGIERCRILKIHENSCLKICSEVSKAKARTEKGNENDICELNCKEGAEIKDIYSPEWLKRSQENSACVTVKVTETKKRNRKDLVEPVGVTTKITEISKSELLEEREKKRRNHETLKKQIGTITGDSAVETVKLNNVLLEESKTKEKSTDKVSDKQVDAQTTLRIVVEALKRYQKMPCSLKPSDVRGRNRRIATVKGEKLSTYYQPFTCHHCKRNDTGEVVHCMYCKEGYCLCCIEKWYPQTSHVDIQRKCPVCHGNCNCKACSATQGNSKLGMPCQTKGQ